jgi:hypothetical protein
VITSPVQASEEELRSMEFKDEGSQRHCAETGASLHTSCSDTMRHKRVLVTFITLDVIDASDSSV